jgi:hypothetical protein
MKRTKDIPQKTDATLSISFGPFYPRILGMTIVSLNRLLSVRQTNDDRILSTWEVIL